MSDEFPEGVNETPPWGDEGSGPLDTEGVREVTCAECMYSHPVAEGDDHLPRLECRRYPQQLVVVVTKKEWLGDGDAPIESELVCAFPPANDVCGEFRANWPTEAH